MAAHAVIFTRIFQTGLWILLSTAVSPLPQARPDDASAASAQTDDSQLTYYIYPTSDSLDTPIINDPSELLDGHPLTVVLHGFKGDHTARSMQAIKEVLLMSGVTNVVVLDWSHLADDSNHSILKAYHNVRDHGVAAAADQAAQWLQEVMETKGVAPADIHLVGFSLGAHASGIIGRNLNSSLGRITGLDPPQFGYEHIGKPLRLDQSDAMFVNVIHTSGDVLGYTETEPIGHVDFFPNGDTLPQKGCQYDSPIDIITCSHYLAFELFAESVLNHNALVATQCDSWKSFSKGRCNNGTHVPMGYPTPATTRGKFFMNTNSSPPYGDEDPANPLPDGIKRLLVYDTSEAFNIKPQDVVEFISQQGKESEALAAPGDDSGVMKVKGVSKTTTTPNPPSFLNSAAATLWGDAFIFIVTAFAGYNVWELLVYWWTS